MCWLKCYQNCKIIFNNLLSYMTKHLLNGYLWHEKVPQKGSREGRMSFRVLYQQLIVHLNLILFRNVFVYFSAWLYSMLYWFSLLECWLQHLQLYTTLLYSYSHDVIDVFIFLDNIMRSVSLLDKMTRLYICGTYKYPEIANKYPLCD